MVRVELGCILELVFGERVKARYRVACETFDTREYTVKEVCPVRYVAVSRDSVEFSFGRQCLDTTCGSQYLEKLH